MNTKQKLLVVETINACKLFASTVLRGLNGSNLSSLHKLLL